MANTHRVTVQTWIGDIRPSRRSPDYLGGSCWTTWTLDTTEHGAKCVFTESVNTELRQPFKVGHEYIPHDATKPDRKVGYFVSQYEGITYTVVIVRERWPRYQGMYDHPSAK